MFLLGGTSQLNVTHWEQPSFPSTGKFGEGELVSDLWGSHSPLLSPANKKHLLSGLGDAQPPTNQTAPATGEAERSHHVPSGLAHCPERRCRFSSHFLMNKKLWTMRELSTSTPLQIQSWVTPLQGLLMVSVPVESLHAGGCPGRRWGSSTEVDGELSDPHSAPTSAFITLLVCQ